MALTTNRLPSLTEVSTVVVAGSSSSIVNVIPGLDALTNQTCLLKSLPM